MKEVFKEIKVLRMEKKRKNNALIWDKDKKRYGEKSWGDSVLEGLEVVKKILHFVLCSVNLFQNCKC